MPARIGMPTDIVQRASPLSGMALNVVFYAAAPRDVPAVLVRGRPRTLLDEKIPRSDATRIRAGPAFLMGNGSSSLHPAKVFN